MANKNSTAKDLFIDRISVNQIINPNNEKVFFDHFFAENILYGVVDEDSNVIPRTFQFNGTIVFITNVDFDAIIDKGNKLAPHLAAMVSRSHYIDLAMKTRRDYFVRIKQVVKQGLLKKGKGLNQKEENKVVRFIEKYQDNLREMSLRVALKLADIIKKHPRQFEEIAKITVTKRL